MDLPKEFGSFKVLQARADKAFKDEHHWHDLYEDIYEYFLPNRNLYDSVGKGQKKTDRVFDGTAPQAIQEGASKLQDAIAPIWRQWSRVEPSDKLKSEFEANGGELQAGDGVTITLDQVQENLDKQTDIAFDYLNRSNFATQFFEFALELLVGTATIKIDEEDDFDEPFTFHAIPNKGIGLEEGHKGTVEGHYRKFEEKIKHVEKKWPGFEMSQELRDKFEKNPEAEVNLIECVVLEPKSRNYWGIAWVKGEDKPSWVQDFEQSSPWITGRYAKIAGEVRGRGPAVQVLPDVKSLNKAKEFVLQKAALDLVGMWTATDDGVTNPYSVTVSPGVVIPVGSNASSNPSIARLDTRSDLQLAQFEIVELQTAIKKAFFNDLRDPEGPVRSATEIAIEQRELAKRLGSAFGRLQTEVLIPILKRVFFILNKKGLININLQGFETSVKFTSPLARAQDSEDLLDIQQAVEFTLNTAGPEYVKANFKVENFGEFAGQKIGMPQELIRSDVDRNKVFQAGVEARMAEMQSGVKPNDVEQA